MRRAVGEGVEPSRSSYHVAMVSYILRHRDKEVCLPNFTILQFSLFSNYKERFSVCLAQI